MELHGAAAALCGFSCQPADVSCLYNNSDAGSEFSGVETMVEIARPAASVSAQDDRVDVEAKDAGGLSQPQSLPQPQSQPQP